MRKSQRKYSFFHLANATFMIFALLWLTISAPFVYNSQQKLAKPDKIAIASVSNIGNEEEPINPFDNNTEEKVPYNGNSFSEEYLHDTYETEYFPPTEWQSHKYESISTYIAFHGEILVPPPNAA